MDNMIQVNANRIVNLEAIVQIVYDGVAKTTTISFSDSTSLVLPDLTKTTFGKIFTLMQIRQPMFVLP